MTKKFPIGKGLLPPSFFPPDFDFNPCIHQRDKDFLSISGAADRLTPRVESVHKWKKYSRGWVHLAYCTSMLTKLERDYISSERFIHDGIIHQIEVMVEEFRNLWVQKRGRINSFAITWVSEPIETPTGVINDKVTFELPLDRPRWKALLVELVEKSKAYGVLLVDVREDSVRAIAETPHGSRCWYMTPVSRGDYKALSRPSPLDNVEELGLLWSKNQGTS